MKQEQDYNIIIIGSGLGGLACGAILSQRGYRVLVLEKHFQIGGSLQNFTRNGYLFDTGMHYIGSYDDGQILNTLFRFFDIYDKVAVAKLSEKQFDIFSIGGKEYHIPQGMEKYKQYLKALFPEEYSAIDTYFEKLQQIYNAVDLINLREIDADTLLVKMGADESLYNYVIELTDNKELQNLFCAHNSLYAGKKESASLFEHAIITQFFVSSAYKLVNGGGQIADALKQVIEKNSGEVRVKSDVKRIVCVDGEAIAVELNNNQVVSADKIISDIDPLKTMEMMEGGNIRKAYLKRLKEITPTISCFSLYIVLKEDTFKFQNSNFYFYKQNDVWALDNYSEGDWPQGYMMYLRKSKKNPNYAESLIILSPMEYQEMHPWEDTTIGKRGEAYKAMKAEKSAALLEVVNTKFPALTQCISHVYSASPLTYRDYVGVQKGAMYGASKDYKNPYITQVSPRTRVKNLFLTGQNINMHGVLGVSMGAILTCGEIVGINRLIKEMKNSKHDEV